MEDALPPFLLRLGLDQQADERAIRRSYARLLKQTDQEADPASFQALREAYEVALLWQAQQRRRAEEAESGESDAPEPATAASQPSSAAGRDGMPSASAHRESDSSDTESASGLVASTDPQAARASTARTSEQAARDVLQELQEKLAGGWPQDRPAARAWLDGVLEGDRLVDMDARFLFEWGVAGILADGWLPGKEHLFGPAMDCFGWRDDRGRLMAFDRAGGIVDAAIAELEYFDSLPDQARAAQRQLIRRLREDKCPSTSALLGQMPLLEQIAQIYPHWLHVVTNTRNIGRWRDWAAQVPKWRRWLTRQPRPARAQARAAAGKGSRFGWAFGVLLVLGALGRLFDSTPSPAPPPASYSSAVGAKPLSRPGSPSGAADSSVEQLLKGVPPLGSPASFARTDPKPLPLEGGGATVVRPAAGATYLVPPKVIYPPIARRLGQEGKVILAAIVDPDGKVRRAQVHTSSGHATLDDAAMTAVLNAAFIPAKDSAGRPIASAYKIPFNFKLSDGEGTSPPPPRSYGETVRDTVRPYVIFGESVSGNPAAEVTLKLAQDGRIQDHKLTKSSANRAWDAAVLRAIQRVPRLPADQNGKVPPEMVIAFRPKA
ncbi:TonB family protein [Variovorax sp. J31P216]|nr:TonB family protein [Variovorax sp. J31P216]